jgi:HEAT repeat protein
MLVLSCALFAAIASAQTQQSQEPQQLQQPRPGKLPYAIDRANVPDAIARVKSGDFFAMHVDLIARADAIEAIPVLKEQFGRVQDSLLKDKIAAALVRLGDKDDSYWDFLVKDAKTALESDAPNFHGFDAEGKAFGGASPEFEAWLKNRGESVDVGSAAEDSMYFLPGKVMNLGWSRDPRAIPYLHQGLSSANYMIEIAAANGLAEIGDENSIPLIINACRKAPKEVAEAMAESLIYFDNSTAQNAVDQYIPKDTAKLYRDERASGRKKKPLTAPLYDSSQNR